MTQRKHLKQLVRERMKETGQPYAAARRAVLLADPAKPKSPHRPGSVPGSTALRVLLAHAGRELSEPMTFGLAGGIGIGVFSFVYEKADFASFFVASRHCWHDHVTYLTRACKRLGLTTVIKESTSPKLAEKQLREMLDAHGPCVAWVDLGGLPHRGMPQSPMTMGYHLVTVYSATDDSVSFGDLTDEPIEMPMAEFTAARGRIKKDKNRLLAVSASAKPGDLAAMFADAMKACHAGLTGADGPKNARKNFSLDALGVWAERLISTKDPERWEKVFTPGKRLWNGLSSIHQYVENYFTGGGLGRPMMAEFLAMSADALNRPALKGLAKQYADLGEAWTSLADAALPDSIPAFAEAKAIRAEYSELVNSSGSIDAKGSCWQRLGEIERQVCAKFPLTPAECAELRGHLAERVRAIHAAEVAVRSQLLEGV